MRNEKKTKIVEKAESPESLPPVPPLSVEPTKKVIETNKKSSIEPSAKKTKIVKKDIKKKNGAVKKKYVCLLGLKNNKYCNYVTKYVAELIY